MNIYSKMSFALLPVVAFACNPAMNNGEYTQQARQSEQLELGGGSPTITGLGCGCQDRFGSNNCIIVKGQGFQPQSKIILRDADNWSVPLDGGSEDIAYTESTPQEHMHRGFVRSGDGYISFRLLRSHAELFRSHGKMAVCVVNPDQGYDCSWLAAPTGMSFYSQCNQPTGGGINYVVSDFGNYESVFYADPHDGISRATATRHPVLHFHENPAVVRSQIEGMKRNGHKKIAVVLWHSHLSWNKNWTSSEVDNGIFRGAIQSNPQDACFQVVGDHPPDQDGYERCMNENLRQLIANIDGFTSLVAENGFNEVIIRFAPNNATTSPKGWWRFESRQFWENYLFMKMIRRKFESGFARYAHILRLYDLGGELAGSEEGYAREYVGKLWWWYIRDPDFGLNDTRYGFSAAVSYGFGQPGSPAEFTRDVMTRMLSTYRDHGQEFPDLYALDLYVREKDSLLATQQVLNDFGEGHKPILVQERYFNDATVQREITMALQEDEELQICYSLAWPLTRYYHRWGTEYSRDVSGIMAPPDFGEKSDVFIPGTSLFAE